jgi:uncharacterized membrane protein YccC
VNAFVVRSALRAAIVMPVCFAIGRAVGGETELFAAFGSFGLLGFIDFSGPRPARALAYLAVAVVGAVLIPLGTLCSRSPAVGTIAMLLVAFVVLQAGIVNGYLAAGGLCALLTFILPVMLPAEPSAIPGRLLGWCIACALAIPAALVWIDRRHGPIRTAAAKALRELATMLVDRGDEAAGRARDACLALRRTFAATPYRPTGPTGTTGALAELVDELDLLRGVLASPFAGSPSPRVTAAQTALRDAAMRVLEETACVLDGTRTTPPDVARLEEMRTASLDDLLGWLADPAEPHEDEAMWCTVSGAFELRVTSFVVLDIVQRAVVASDVAYVREEGDGTLARTLAFVRRQGIALEAGARLATAHTTVRSVWFRNSLRGAVGLAAAVLVAQLTSVTHAFWVVLAVLSVLRSSALVTGETTVRALLGTSVGLVVGGVILALVGTATTLLWFLLPVAVFFAIWAPKQVSFIAGQAAFTVLILILFNLVVPEGWKVGLVRIQDVAIGFAISLAVGVLFWPRGAGSLLRRTLGEALAAGGEAVAAAFQALTGTVDLAAGQAAVDRAAVADSYLDAAFRQRLAERGGELFAFQDHARLTAFAGRLRETGSLVLRLDGLAAGAPRPVAAGAALREDADGAAQWYRAFGDALAERTAFPPPQDHDGPDRDASLAGLREVAGSGDAPTGMGAVAMTWGELHLATLRRLEGFAVESASAIAR